MKKVKRIKPFTADSFEGITPEEPKVIDIKDHKLKIVVSAISGNRFAIDFERGFEKKLKVNVLMANSLYIAAYRINWVLRSYGLLEV